MKIQIPAITSGLDLGDKKHALCVLNQDGEIIDERTITNHRESLRRPRKLRAIYIPSGERRENLIPFNTSKIYEPQTQFKSHLK